MIGAVLCLLGAAKSRGADIEPRLAIPLFLKIVSYDHSFVTPTKPDTLRMFFLYDFSDTKSYQQYQDTQEYVRSAGDLTVSGVPVKLLGIQTGDADSIITSTPDSLYSILVCGTGRGAAFRELSSRLEKRNCHSFAMNPEDMAVGLSVSIDANDRKTIVLVNLNTAKAEGSRFSSQLLSLCRIVDRQT
jgi:hypothetical protein